MRISVTVALAAVALGVVPAAGVAAAAPEPEPAERVVGFRLSLGPDGPVGVGQLIMLRFDEPVRRRAAVEQALSITGSKALPPGRWGWWNPQTVVYRPRTWWPARTVVRVAADLDGVTLGVVDGVRLVAGRSVTESLRTGRALVLRIVDAQHHLVVTRDGKRVRTLPVSLGKRGWETTSGVKILTGEQYRVVRMTGGRGANRWDVMAPYSIRLTPSGEFLHGAPWANYRIGKANGSHGCTNLFVRHARWLYQHVRAGDPVVTTGTGAPVPLTDGWPGTLWNIPWPQWRQRSALV